MMLLPRRLRRGNRVSVGMSWIAADGGTVGDDVRIGHLNIIRNVKRLTLGDGCYFLNGNQVFGARSYDHFPGIVSIGPRVGVMSRHFIDASGEVRIDEGAVIAGRDTQIWTHTLTRSDGLVPLTVHVGARCYVGARCTLVGCKIPDDWVVGAGAVVVDRFDPEPTPCLIAGNPARIAKRYPPRDEG